MKLRVIGAGLPRTGTSSLRVAFEHLLGGRCYHMSLIPGHPFDLGPAWDGAIDGKTPDWNVLFKDYLATVDWPSSMFWEDLSQANPDALVLLSQRESAEIWWKSANETILPAARMALSTSWKEGRGIVTLFERFTGTNKWDDQGILMTAYDRHNAHVRETVPTTRLLEWHPSEGWAPICRRLGLPIPKILFPWVSRRSEWS